MKIFALYRDFFKFLEKISSPSEKWQIYSAHYYRPHREFLKSYFSLFPLINLRSLKQRVEAIRSSDYSWLEHLISVSPPEKIIRESYEKCRNIVTPEEEPEVYLIIGFFSPDAFVMVLGGKPVVCFGLERFKDFRLLRILFAHEYAHFLLNLSSGEVPEEKKLKWLLVSEGLATYFSQLAFPKQKMSDHSLLSRDTWNWCQANEPSLREIYCSGRFSSQELFDFYGKGNAQLDIPPRAGKYLGFQAVKRYFAQNSQENIRTLLSDKNSALSLEL